jgi:hypothetical protein
MQTYFVWVHIEKQISCFRVHTLEEVWTLRGHLDLPSGLEFGKITGWVLFGKSRQVLIKPSFKISQASGHHSTQVFCKVIFQSSLWYFSRASSYISWHLKISFQLLGFNKAPGLYKGVRTAVTVYISNSGVLRVQVKMTAEGSPQSYHLPCYMVS